jgi:hypothetical protein
MVGIMISGRSGFLLREVNMLVFCCTECTVFIFATVLSEKIHADFSIQNFSHSSADQVLLLVL